MPTTYIAAGRDVNELIGVVLAKHQPDLLELGVTVSCVLVMKANKDGMPEVGLKRNGYPAAAKIGVASADDRARGLADAKLTIDDYAWSRLSAHQREALIDHELQHLEPNPTEDEDGQAVDRDDLGRPRLKLRPHDYELAGFAGVVKRHRENSIESLTISRFKADLGTQLGFWS